MSSSETQSTNVWKNGQLRISRVRLPHSYDERTGRSNNSGLLLECFAHFARGLFEQAV